MVLTATVQLRSGECPTVFLDIFWSETSQCFLQFLAEHAKPWPLGWQLVPTLE